MKIIKVNLETGKETEATVNEVRNLYNFLSGFNDVGITDYMSRTGPIDDRDGQYLYLLDTVIDRRILELEKEHGKLNPAVCLQIAEEVAKQKFCKFTSLLEAIDAGSRIGFAYITLGVVSSPIEGLTEIKIMKTKEGKEYFVPYYFW